jgi:lysophospholipase L1-like esterase
LAGLILATGTAGAATVIDPSDASIQYTGRWDFSNPSQPWAQAKASSIIVNFNGTSIATTISGGSGEKLRAIIDDDVASSSMIQLQSGVSQTWASGLADSGHKLELFKETDHDRMTVTALTLDTGKTLSAPPARPTRRIEFYGDSNVAGHSLESERDQGGYEGAYFTYAGIASRMLGAEHVNHSLSGAWTTSLLNSHDRTDWNSTNPTWDFSNFPADVVIVNIGANDTGPKKKIKDSYRGILAALRTAHPNAHIVLFNAYGWDFNEPANYTHEVISEEGDPNTSVALFPWFFEQYHGCEYDHAGMATDLVAHLETIMG